METHGQLGFLNSSDRHDPFTPKGNPLEPLAIPTTWARFRTILEKSLGRYKHQMGGRSSSDAVLMFNVLVLQAPYNLSDDQADYQIQDNAYRDKPLSAKLIQTNQRISWTRSSIEHIFGHQVMSMDRKLLHTISHVRACVMTGLKNLTDNFQPSPVLRSAVRR